MNYFCKFSESLILFSKSYNRSKILWLWGTVYGCEEDLILKGKGRDDVEEIKMFCVTQMSLSALSDCILKDGCLCTN